MINNAKALEEVWEWKESAYKELSDCHSLREKIRKRISIINQNVKIPEPAAHKPAAESGH